MIQRVAVGVAVPPESDTLGTVQRDCAIAHSRFMNTREGSITDAALTA